MVTASLRSDALANRDRLIEAARSLFVERGVDAEMKEIAERAGLGVGTIYRNFATKDDLVAAIVESCMLEALVELRRTMEIGDLRARLMANFDIAWSFAERFGPLIRAIGVRGAQFERHPAEEFQALLLVTFEAGLAAGVVRPGLEPVFVAHYLATQFQAYVDLRAFHPEAVVREQLTRLAAHAILVDE